MLPLDIIVIILKRLPIKSIVQLRCLCKDWRNLIKTPSFIAEHLHHPGNVNPFLLLHERDYGHKPSHQSVRLLNHDMKTVEVLGIPRIDCLSYSWRIIGSCNGLLCVEDGSPLSLCLWNPVIREVREIPLTRTKDHCEFGFAFSSTINDYKIMKFCGQTLHRKKKNHPHHGAEVYSLSTGSWKQLEFGALKNTSIISKPVSTDGTMFWVGVKDDFFVLVSFNVATEVFTLTPMPVRCVGCVYQTILAVYGNKFAILRHSCDASFNSIDIWVMEKVANESGQSFSCTEEYNIGRISWFFHLVCIWRNEIVFYDKDGGDCPYLGLFDLTTRKWKKFEEFSSDGYDWCTGFSYERSLVSVWNTQVE